MGMVSVHKRDDGSLRERVLRRIRGLRLRKGLSQKLVAHRAGMTQSAYSRFEGGRKSADLDTVQRAGRALDVHPEHILGQGVDSIPDPAEEGDRNEDGSVGGGGKPCVCLSLLLEKEMARLRERGEVVEILRVRAKSL